ncbi:HPF/RaiA family ribosome-associated protein [Halovulum dunhuangense]|uniref:HPF/RaiA family ribosome-associated protein n=1 Tax=Halovulum dunhuangense TaxID=1505036 RepID=A0A849L5Y4_9RHOB|nr:HPF/RaiA family ribosome-associated protein [Halovulum dunhuangense]
MHTDPQIAFVDIDPDVRIERRIRERLTRLDRLSDKLISCSVKIRAPHQRHQKGTRYIVDIAAELPDGGRLSVGRSPGDDGAHQDPLVAVRDAFDAMERQLKRWKEQHGGRPTVLEHPLQGRITRIEPGKDFGEIATTDGRNIYFHRNAVLGDGFDALLPGDTVELTVDQRDADKGPHASMVRPITRAAFTDKP